MSVRVRDFGVIAAIGVLCLPATGAAQTVSVRAPKAGDTVVVGYITPPNSSAAGVVVEAKADGALVERVVTTMIDPQTGRFEARMVTLLAAETIITACVRLASAETCGNATVPTPKPPPAPGAPSLRPVRVGARVIDGFVHPAGTRAATVLVRVFRDFRARPKSIAC